MLLVVMGHLYYFSCNASQSLVFEWIVSFHMPLFMFLSGVVLSTPNIPKVLKQLRRFLLPMIIFGILFTLSLQSSLSLKSIPTVLHDFVFSPDKNGYWYLLSLSIFYCSMLLFHLNRKNSPWVDILISLFLFCVYKVGYSRGGVVSDVLCLQSCASFFPFFIAGYLVRKHNLLRYLTYTIWIGVVALGLFLFFLTIDMPIAFVSNIAARFVVPTCAIIAMVNLFERRERKDSLPENILQYIGRSTLDVYVLHYFIVANISLVVFDRWTIATGNTLLSMVVMFLLSVPIACVTVEAGKLLRRIHFPGL